MGHNNLLIRLVVDLEFILRSPRIIYEFGKLLMQVKAQVLTYNDSRLLMATYYSKGVTL